MARPLENNNKVVVHYNSTSCLSLVLGVGTIYLGENGDPTNPALIFPTIVHVAQTLVAIIMGSLGLLILFLSKKKSNVSS